MIQLKRIIEGPIHLDDIPQEDWPPLEVVEDGMMWLIEAEAHDTEVEEDFEGSFYFTEFDVAYDIDKHLRYGGGPVQIRDDGSIWIEDECISQEEYVVGI